MMFDDMQSQAPATEGADEPMEAPATEAPEEESAATPATEDAEAPSEGGEGTDMPTA